MFHAKWQTYKQKQIIHQCFANIVGNGNQFNFLSQILLQYEVSEVCKSVVETGISMVKKRQ